MFQLFASRPRAFLRAQAIRSTPWAASARSAVRAGTGGQSKSTSLKHPDLQYMHICTEGTDGTVVRVRGNGREARRVRGSKATGWIERKRRHGAQPREKKARLRGVVAVRAQSRVGAWRKRED